LLLPAATPHTRFPYTTLFRSHGDAARAIEMGMRVAVGRGAVGGPPRMSHAGGPGRRALGRQSGFELDELARALADGEAAVDQRKDRKSTRWNSSHLGISYAVF